MSWRKDERLVAEGFRDLQYLPHGRSGWDATLASLAYGVRRQIERGQADLAAWAARHGAAAPARYARFGDAALVLWHGTSRQRADKIAEHGLFHKRGVWTTLDPWVAHSYCRLRSERFASQGALLCIVMDRRDLVEGRHYEVEGRGDVLRFHQGLAPEVVQYVLAQGEIRFTGDGRAARPAPWPRARFRRGRGGWVPVQQAPVRFSEGATFSSLEDFLRLCLGRLLAELGEVAAIEVFSTLYALVQPRDALTHKDIFGLIEEYCGPGRSVGKWETFRARRS